MEAFPILSLAVIQGVTESLPISSSAHLALFPLLWGGQPQEPLVDIAVHLGTGAAFVVYFFPYVLSLIRGFFHFVRRRKTEESVFWVKLFFGTMPAVLAGFVIQKMGWHMGTIGTTGFFSLFFGLLLGISDKTREENPWNRDVLFQNVSLRQFFILGCLQTLAFFPGVSRLGICLMGARFMGLSRFQSASLSFVMGIPVTLGAFVLNGPKILSLGQTLVVPMMVSGILCLVGIGFFMAWVKRHSLQWVMIYRMILGCVLLAYAFFQ